MNKELINKVTKYTDNELKQEFIKYFGIEKWNQEEALGKLLLIQIALCNYLELEPIPVIVDDILEDSRYYPKESYIVISSNLIGDEVEALKCLIHEMKHYQQYMCVIHNITTVPQLEDWKKDFKINYANITSYEEMLTLSVEIDAFSFTKYIMDKWFNLTINHPEPIYDELLTRYIKKYF